MASIERTAYPRFRRMVSAKELVECGLTADEITWAREQTRSESHLLTLVLSLTCFKRLGYFTFPTSFKRQPPADRACGRAPSGRPSSVPQYEEPGTRAPSASVVSRSARAGKNASRAVGDGRNVAYSVAGGRGQIPDVASTVHAHTLCESIALGASRAGGRPVHRCER